MIYAYCLENDKVDLDLRKNPIVEAIQAFLLPDAAYDAGVKGEELEKLVQRSLLSLELQKQAIASRYGVDLLSSSMPVRSPSVPTTPMEVVLPNPPSEGSIPVQVPLNIADTLIDDDYLMDDEM
jgi:hypothetical protein